MFGEGSSLGKLCLVKVSRSFNKFCMGINTRGFRCMENMDGSSAQEFIDLFGINLNFEAK